VGPLLGQAGQVGIGAGAGGSRRAAIKVTPALSRASMAAPAMKARITGQSKLPNPNPPPPEEETAEPPAVLHSII
jgi:hypothetical protein